MIDYANFKQARVFKHLKMRIQIHAKLVPNAKIHTHIQWRASAAHIFAYFSDFSIVIRIWALTHSGYTALFLGGFN